MVSAVGMDVVTSCASARAGLARVQELDISESGEDELQSVPLKGHPIKGLTDGFVGAGRLIRIGDAALGDLLRNSGLEARGLLRTGLILALPGSYYVTLQQPDNSTHGATVSRSEYINDEDDEDSSQLASVGTGYVDQVLRIMLSLRGLTHSLTIQECFHGGPAVFVEVLARAAMLLRSGTLDRCIVGGVDSLVYGDALEQVYHLGLVKGLDNPTGFLPGEAGAFVLLERHDAASMRRARPKGHLVQVAAAAETNHRFSDNPPTGLALFLTIEECLRSATCLNPDTAIVNLNGDPLRAMEYASALSRMGALGIQPARRTFFPAESFGELGAATGAAAMCLAVRDFERSVNTSTCLVPILADDIARGAFLMAPVEASRN